MNLEQMAARDFIRDVTDRADSLGVGMAKYPTAEIKMLLSATGQMRTDIATCEKELTEVSVAIGSVRWMDLPDGGSVGLGEQVARMRSELESHWEALTPSGNTKAEYIGEFQFTVTTMELDESDEPYECQRMVTVPWDTIKQIMRAIRVRADRT